MADPMKATLFICRAHGANPMALRALLKDPRVAYSELMPSCCSPEGQDQIALHLKAGTTQALVVAGCSPKHLGRYQEMAGAAGVPLARVAVVPASACKNPAMTDQALSRVLDPRASWSAPERASERLLLVGDGISADQALRQAVEEGIEHLRMTSSEVLTEGNRLIGGPNDFILECGEEMHRFGAALLVMDMRIEVHRERLSEAPGTALLLLGGEECLEAFWTELGQLRDGKTYVIAQETPFPGANELLYADAQGHGTTFLRSAQAEVRSGGVMVHDEHLDEDVLLPVGQVIIVRSSRPPEAASLLRLFGLPKDHRSAEMEPGRSGMPGVYLAGSAYTEFAGPDARDGRPSRGSGHSQRDEGSRRSRSRWPGSTRKNARFVSPA